MKVFNIIFCLLFIVSAALQYNDPDSALWILIYLFAALSCYLSIRNLNYPRTNLTAIVLLFSYAVFLFFDKDGVLTWLTEHQAENIAGSMKASTPWIEETREFFGLAIILTVLSINFFDTKRNRSILK
jgi:hypothetical protein